MEYNNQELFERIEKKRKERGLTQSQLAEKSGFERRVFTRRFKAIKIETLYKICEVLECTPSYLLGFSENNNLSERAKSLLFAYSFDYPEMSAFISFFIEQLGNNEFDTMQYLDTLHKYNYLKNAFPELEKAWCNTYKAIAKHPEKESELVKDFYNNAGKEFLKSHNLKQSEFLHDWVQDDNFYYELKECFENIRLYRQTMKDNFSVFINQFEKQFDDYYFRFVRI